MPTLILTVAVLLTCCRAVSMTRNLPLSCRPVMGCTSGISWGGRVAGSGVSTVPAMPKSLSLLMSGFRPEVEDRDALDLVVIDVTEGRVDGAEGRVEVQEGNGRLGLPCWPPGSPNSRGNESSIGDNRLIWRPLC